jgi:phospholipid/cholesterol/gamma-HCH transport system ATP-binding protein
MGVMVSREHVVALPGLGDASMLKAALERLLAGPPELVDRLRHAQTSVAFEVADDPAIVLLLDRSPPRIGEDGGTAEVVIRLDRGQATAFVAGNLPLPTAVIAGDVRFSGPVRKVLEVDAILRTLLYDGPRHHDRDRPGIDRDGGYAPSPDLLAIETRGLEKSFGDTQVLRGLDLKIPEGVISVVLGPSGTGKSVCLQHVIGIMRPDAGDVLIRGRALSGMSRSEILGLRRSIGVMFQDGALFSASTVFENVAFPLRQHTDLPDDAIRDIVMSHLEDVGLGAAAQLMPHALSGGMRKRAGLARALALSPSIVLVDEPDSGLDPVRTALLGDLLVERHGAHGGTMVVVTHNVMLARSIADHISVIWQGEVLESGMTEQILASETPFIRQFLAGDTAGPLSMDA